MLLDNAIDIINERDDIKSLVVECSFPVELESLAIISKHLTPKLLFEGLELIKRDDIKLYINHMKPSYFEKISKEITGYAQKWEPKIIKEKEIIIL